MELIKYNEKHVRVKDIYGKTHTGVADFFDAEYLLHEYGYQEDGIIIAGFLLCESQIASIEEIEVHGTAELRTERLILRRYRPEDAEELYRYFGTEPAMYQYSGWNPYATPEMAAEAVRRQIAGYEDPHFYGWVIDFEDVVFGTIGAYDYREDQIEVGFSIEKRCWGRGYATEALKAVVQYLTENEGIPCVSAWCAKENIGSRRVLEKAGMRLVDIEKDGLTVADRVYDRLVYEYRAEWHQPAAPRNSRR